jgi:hypothetical protein
MKNLESGKMGVEKRGKRMYPVRPVIKTGQNEIKNIRTQEHGNARRFTVEEKTFIEKGD